MHITSRFAVPTGWLCFLACQPAVHVADPGFQVLDADKVGMRISNASSGEVCSDYA